MGNLNLTSCCPKPKKGVPNPPTPALPLEGMPLTLETEEPIKVMLAPFPRYAVLPPIEQSVGTRARERPANGRGPDLIGRDGAKVLFAKYKDLSEDAILAEGLERLCTDLEVNPDDFRVLVLAWKFGAATMCRFTQSEFVEGCKTIGANSLESIKAKLPFLLQEVASDKQFKDFYRWSYRFALEADSGQRTLPTDMAISLWRLVFSQREPPTLNRWLLFLEKDPSIKGIARDTWDMFLVFVEQIGDNLEAYSDSEAWPSLLDDFVESERA